MASLWQEDDSRLRSSLGLLLGQLEGCEVVSLHPNAKHALENLPDKVPSVVLMDINLPGIDGIECIRRLKPLMPGTEFVILTVYEDLSPREREVLESLSKGLLYKEIADSLGISYATVNNHVRNIYRKLHVNSRTEAVTAWLASRGRGHG